MRTLQTTLAAAVWMAATAATIGCAGAAHADPAPCDPQTLTVATGHRAVDRGNPARDTAWNVADICRADLGREE